MDTWKYYNHALLPEVAPHEIPNLELLKKKEIWRAKGNGKALLARWISDFDCQKETNWWYCMKDSPLDLNAMKAKRRYEIKRGKQFFDCRIINPKDHMVELFEIQKAAVASYPEANRYQVEYTSFCNQVLTWESKRVYGAFDKTTGKLSGYLTVRVYSTYAYLESQKVIPELEKNQINAALVCAVLEDFNEKLSGNYYIVDGERNIYHETKFQDYLEKYFGFRKAYCRLHLKYRTGIGLAVKILYPFRGCLKRIRNNSFIRKISGVLFMEELVREQKR